jgi:hypothetical protein
MADPSSLLARFEPPANVTTLRVYADRDEARLTAALKFLERLQGPYRRRRASAIVEMVDLWLRQFEEHLPAGRLRRDVRQLLHPCEARMY